MSQGTVFTKQRWLITMKQMRYLKEIGTHLLIMCSLVGSLAYGGTIQVTAQIRETGCDLIDAINTANSNSPQGGCTATGTLENDDRIILNDEVAIPEHIVYLVDNTNANGPNGLPQITSGITIVGSGSEPTVISRDPNSIIPPFRLFYLASSTANLTLRNVSIENGLLEAGTVNPEEGSGAAVFVGIGALFIQNSNFINNNAANFGGAIYAQQQSIVSVSNALFSNNRSSGSFGGGGAISLAQEVDGLAAEIVDSEFTNNFSASRGGAINVRGSNDTITLIGRSLFINNRSNNSGGAVNLGVSADVTIADSTLTNNQADLDQEIGGGAISAYGVLNGARLSVINSTITNNQSTDGAIIFRSFDNASVDQDQSFITIVNTILSGNINTRVSVNRDLAYYGLTDEVLSIKNSIIGEAGSTTNQSSTALTGNLDPSLFVDNIFATSDGNAPTPLARIISPLADNGGGTRTHALPAGSPAIDNGAEGFIINVFLFLFYQPGCRGITITAPTPLPDFRLDQRMIERPIGRRCDIGPYEYEDQSICFPISPSNGNTALICL